MIDNLSQYGRGKVEATLKILGRAWGEAWEKQRLRPDALTTEDGPKEVLILNRHIVSWLKRERLDHDDLSNILDRLKSENVILDHVYAMLDEEKVNPYFSHSYHSVSLPADFEERCERYLQNLSDSSSFMHTGTVTKRPNIHRRYRSTSRTETALNIILIPVYFILRVCSLVFSLLWKVVRDIVVATYEYLIKHIGTVIALALLGGLLSFFF